VVRTDKGFVRRVHVTTAWFGAIVLVTLAGWGYDWLVYTAVAVGAVIALAAIQLTNMAVIAATNPTRPRRHLITAAFLLKLPIAASIFYLLTQRTVLSSVGLACGLGLPVLVLLLKLAGQGLTAKRSESEDPSSMGEEAGDKAS
jgi:hypothetical protein